MIRIASSALLVAALAACASSGAAAGGGAAPGPDSQRVTHSVPMPDGNGGLRSETYTTYARGAPAPSQIAAPADSVYAALATSYEELGIPVGTTDPNSRTIGNTQLRAHRRLGRTALSEYLDCGHAATGSAAADHHRVRLSVLSTAEPAANGSQLSTVVQAFHVRAESGESSPCSTTGVLETAIARAVQRKFGGR